MFYVGYFWFFIVFKSCGQVRSGTWTESNIKCRLNDDNTVDWWAIYKPPSRSFVERGRFFVYLTEFSEGRWEPSEVYITARSMLFNTIEPMFMETIYRNDIAVVVYTERPGKEGSIVQGVLLADENGGIWLTHTVPGLPDVNQDKPKFPEDEIGNGHMLMCMSLDHAGLDNIAKLISQTEPEFTRITVPRLLADMLPTWASLTSPLQKLIEHSIVGDFYTRGGTLNPILMVRKPGSSYSLLETFARAKKVVLDVYGIRNMKSVCSDIYGVRQIQAVSLKFPEEIHYVDNSTDRATFAVSTAAHWQRTGAGPAQYWTCISSHERNRMLRRGRMLLCVQSYDVWIAFDNLKIKEPSC